MGQISTILTKQQKLILSLFQLNEYLRKTFYFTGGTALAEYYLQHRYSDDLDFFTDKEFSSQTILDILLQWGKNNNFKVKLNTIENVNIYLLEFDKENILKVDFVHYPYKSIENKTIKDDIAIDSLHDIATNKLLCIQQRTDIKDFVDLYYLLKKFDIWSLSYALKEKFNIEMEPFIMASDLLKIDQLAILPRAIEKIRLEELQNFYRDLAKRLGKQATS